VDEIDDSLLGSIVVEIDEGKEIFGVFVIRVTHRLQEEFFDRGFRRRWGSLRE
jgi:hypothetical protein